MTYISSNIYCSCRCALKPGKFDWNSLLIPYGGWYIYLNVSYIFGWRKLNQEYYLLHFCMHLNQDPFHYLAPTGGEVVTEAGCYTKGPGFEFRVRHGCRAVHPWPHQWLRSKTVRWVMLGSFLGCACRPSRSEFSMVFSETRVNTG